MSAILSIYLLAIAVLPCADEAGWCVFDIEDALGLELHESGTHDHNKDCADHCSPFCTCSCCHINLRTPVKTSVLVNPPIPLFSDTPSRESILADLAFISDIWQPPQLS